MGDGGVTHFKLGSLCMHPFPTCCTRITNMFKHGRYSNRSNVFKQHERFVLLLENLFPGMMMKLTMLLTTLMMMTMIRDEVYAVAEVSVY